MILIDSIARGCLDYDDDYVYIQQGKEIIQISRKTIDHIIRVLPKD